MRRGVPVVVDAEKDRPHLKELLPLVDYVICNRNFPEVFTGRRVKQQCPSGSMLGKNSYS